MFKKLNKIVFVVFLCAFHISAEDESEIKYEPIRFGGGLEVGQIVNGKFFNQASGSDPIKAQLITRLDAAMFRKATFNERLEVEIGVGGLFWYSYSGAFNDWWTVPTKFGPGVAIAKGGFTFGDVETSKTKVEFGFFPVKYNSQASNLGEYLYRVRPYPGALYTGSWTTINTAAYMAHGMRFQFESMGGKLKHEFGLYFERDFFPFNDLTPSYLVSMDLGNIQLGAGLAYHHLIPVRPSLVKGSHDDAKHIEGTIVEYEYFPQIEQAVAGDTILLHSGTGSIQNTHAAFKEMRDSTGSKPVDDSIYVSTSNRNLFLYATDPGYNAATFESIENHKKETKISAQGINIVLHGNFNITEDFSVFLEAAILGVQNQPFFYEKISKRIPVMFGVNVPTGGFFKTLTFQGEYYGTDNVNTVFGLQKYKAAVPIHYTPSYDDAPVSAGYDTDKDNLKWSIYSKKSLVPGLTLHFQIASDHMRLKNEFAADNAEPLLSRPSHWYYMGKLEFGI